MSCAPHPPLSHHVLTGMLLLLLLLLLLYQGNPALRRLGNRGSFFIRGIEYTFVARDDESLDWTHMNNGGYLGGGPTSCVWKARREPKQPMHDVRDPKHKVDRICPVLNADDVSSACATLRWSTV